MDATFESIISINSSEITFLWSTIKNKLLHEKLIFLNIQSKNVFREFLQFCIYDKQEKEIIFHLFADIKLNGYVKK